MSARNIPATCVHRNIIYVVRHLALNTHFTHSEVRSLAFILIPQPQPEDPCAGNDRQWGEEEHCDGRAFIVPDCISAEG
jgi:hypothetical protein